MHLTAIQLVLSIASGAVVGFVLGLIGGGGSIMALPLLIYVVGVTATHLAIGTTALAVAVSAYMNLIPHARRGNVHWPSAVLFALPGAAGAALGSALGKVVGGRDLLFLFAILMLVISGLMVRHRKPAEEAGPRPKATARLVAAGLGAGALAGFFGIGGGFLIVPGLILATAMPLITAVGTSLFAVGTFGLTTAVSYALSGLISWPIAAAYVAGGAGGGVLGTSLATTLGGRKNALNYVFSGIVAAVAIYMLYVNYGLIFG